MGAADSYVPGTFARFFRAVEGRLVSRYGTATSPRGYKKGQPWRNAQTIGGRRAPMTEAEQVRAASPAVGRLGAKPCNPVELDLEMVTAITHEEAARYGREYDRAVAAGSLTEVTEADYIAWLRKCDDRAAAATQAAEAKRKAVEEAAKREAQLAADLAEARRNTTPAAAASARTDEPEVPA
jgi:hypothetical protein